MFAQLVPPRELRGGSVGMGTLLLVVLGSGSSKGWVWAGASFPTEQCTTFSSSYTLVLLLPGKSWNALGWKAPLEPI